MVKRAFVFLILIFSIAVIHAETARDTMRKASRIASRNLYKGLQMILDEPEHPDVAALKYLNEAYQFYNAFTKDDSEDITLLEDVKFMECAILYCRATQISDPRMADSLLDIAANNIYDVQGNGNIPRDWFPADLIWQAKEKYIGSNAYLKYNYRKKRLEISEDWDIRERIFLAYTDLAQTEADLGLFAKSTSHLDQALRELKKPQKKKKNRSGLNMYDKIYYANILTAQLNIYLFMDSLDRAGEVVNTAKKELKIDANNFTYPELYEAFCYYLIKVGNEQEALRKLDIFIQNPGMNSPSRYALIARCYHLNGSNDLAELYYKKCVEGYKTSDKEGLSVAQASLNLAIFYSEQDSIFKATEYVRMAQNKLAEFIETSFPLMGSQEKQLAMKRQEIYLDQLGKLADNIQLQKSHEFAELLLQFSSMYKGLVLVFQDHILELACKDTIVGKALMEVNRDIRLLAYNYHPDVRHNFGEWHLQEDEHTLMQLASERQKLFQAPKVSDLAFGLDSTTAFIDFIPLYRSGNPQKYVAVLLKNNGQKYIYRVITEKNLNWTSDNEGIVFRGMNISTKPRIRPADTLAALLFPPEELIGGINKLYISPAGRLYEVPFSILKIPYQKNHEFIYTYLVSPFSLTQKSEPGLKPDTCYLRAYGGADYKWLSAFENTDSTCDKPWNYLPGTLSEVKQLRPFCALHTSNTGVQFSESSFRGYHYFDAMSTRDKFKADIIHISTHGFYTTPVNGTFFESSLNPLLRCGLLASGANCVWTNDTAKLRQVHEKYFGYDGVITGLEISILDMRKTKLLVLSACETGRGEDLGAEGPMGLPRAFKSAGVEFIMVTLWPVSDEETVVFMKKYYENITNLHDLEKALQKTQNDLKNEGMSKYTWAAFTLVR